MSAPVVTAGCAAYGRQLVDEADVAAVVAVLRGERLTQGPAVASFEADLSGATGAPHAVAVANGTLALEVAYAAIGVGPGTRVLVPANTFVATASAAVRLGAEVEFVDVEPDSGNLDLRALARRLERGRTPDLVVAVHFAGLPCEMALLLELKRAFGFALVEDAAHALGARWRQGGRWWSPGAHPEVEAATYSFHPVKPITCGEGGAVLTADAGVAQRAALLRTHGVDHARVAGDVTSAYAPMMALGTNARLSDLHAALGRSQLAKLDRFRTRRAAIAARYRVALRGVTPLEGGDGEREHAWHLFVVRVDEELRDPLRAALAARGVGTQVHYHPVPHQPWYARRLGDVAVPAAAQHARTALSLPLHPGLTDEDVEYVVEAVHAALDEVGAVR